MWLAHLSIMKSGIIIGLVMPRSAKALQQDMDLDEDVKYLNERDFDTAGCD